MTTKLAILAVLALGAVGCNKTIFMSSAPAKTGYIYVVGSKNDRAQGWLCPAQPGQGRCQEIEMETER